MNRFLRPSYTGGLAKSPGSTSFRNVWMISKFRAAGRGLSAGAMTVISDDQPCTNMGKDDAYRLQRGEGGKRCSVYCFEKKDRYMPS